VPIGLPRVLGDLWRHSPMILGAACTILVPRGQAETYYVSAETGADDAAGKTPDTAFHSFAPALALLKPGDRLVIASGLYKEPMRVSVSGTAEAPIEIQGAAGARPMVRAEEDAISIDADYIVLSHLDAVGATGSAIVIQPKHHHVTVADNLVHDSGTAGIVGIQTDYLSILRNRAFGNAMTSIWQGSGISIYQAANFDTKPGFHNVIAQNIAYGNYNKVPDPKLPPATLGHTTDGNGIIIDDFRHTQVWMGKTTPPYTAESLVENNLVFDNGGRGIQVFLSDNVTVRNNTSVRNLQDPKLLGTKFGEIQAVYAKNIKMFNNIMVPRNDHFYGVMAADAKALEADYNLTVGGSATYFFRSSGIAWGAHNTVGHEPGFRAPDAEGDRADFHLTARSEALGRGDPRQAPAVDLDGHARRGDGPADVGAYQFAPG